MADVLVIVIADALRYSAGTFLAGNFQMDVIFVCARACMCVFVFTCVRVRACAYARVFGCNLVVFFLILRSDRLAHNVPSFVRHPAISPPPSPFLFPSQSPSCRTSPACMVLMDKPGPTPSWCLSVV